MMEQAISETEGIFRKTYFCISLLFLYSVHRELERVSTLR